jgi:hypothetical protein
MYSYTCDQSPPPSYTNLPRSQATFHIQRGLLDFTGGNYNPHQKKKMGGLLIKLCMFSLVMHSILDPLLTVIYRYCFSIMFVAQYIISILFILKTVPSTSFRHWLYPIDKMSKFKCKYGHISHKHPTIIYIHTFIVWMKMWRGEVLEYRLVPTSMHSY